MKKELRRMHVLNNQGDMWKSTTNECMMFREIADMEGKDRVWKETDL